MPEPALTEVRSRTNLIVENVVLAIAYTICAYVGLRLDAVSGFATLVWPASGIAIAAVLLSGPAILPGVFAGAFAANYMHGAPALMAGMIAVGNSLEPLVGMCALRFVEFRPSLKRLRDAIAFILLGAIGSTVISAAIGATTLRIFGIAAPHLYGEAFRSWWIGDIIGDLTVAPMVLVWSRTLSRTPRAPRVLESAALAIVGVITVLLVFALPREYGVAEMTGVYLVFPVLIWAAVRFGPRGAISTGFIVTAAAIAATVGGSGPFANADLHHGLFELQMFVGVEAATFLVLGASIGERREAELRESEARAAAERANHAKSEFLAVMSHELRTPLNAIAGYVQMLEMELHGPLTAGQRDTLARLQRNEAHLLSLINDILGFARAEAGNLSLYLEAIPVTEAVEEIEALVRPEVARKDVSYSAACEASGMTVFADRERLRQILLNITGNAIKFTPAGGYVRLTAYRDEAGCVELRVADTGIGIEPENLSRVFEPFVQAQSGRARSFSGVGLGLAIVRDLVTAMNGKVWLESRVGVGTTVIVKLPEGPPVVVGT